MTTERHEQIAKHLERCAPCLRAFGFENELRRLIADRCRDKVPEGLRLRIASAIDHEHKQRLKTGGNTGNLTPDRTRPKGGGALRCWDEPSSGACRVGCRRAGRRAGGRPE